MFAPPIEAEIAFGLRTSVEASDNPEAVLGSVEWVARAFEIVDCHYEGWRFSGPDSVIDFSHHAALIVGERRPVATRELGALSAALGPCLVTLLHDGTRVDEGTGANALGHPA